MKREIQYLNTNLDLVSAHGLEALTAAFDSEVAFPLHLVQRDDGRWHATLETNRTFREPEPNIAAFLEVIESFEGHTRELWLACESRELNIGYDCGDEPWAFSHGLSAAALARMAALSISLRITLYPATSTTLPNDA